MVDPATAAVVVLNGENAQIFEVPHHQHGGPWFFNRCQIKLRIWKYLAVAPARLRGAIKNPRRENSNYREEFSSIEHPAYGMDSPCMPQFHIRRNQDRERIAG